MKNWIQVMATESLSEGKRKLNFKYNWKEKKKKKASSQFET